MTNIFNYECKKTDFHIHPRPDCFEYSVVKKYAEIAKNYGFDAIGFLEHGFRLIKNHDSILKNKDDCNRLVEICKSLQDTVGIDLPPVFGPV